MLRGMDVIEALDREEIAARRAMARRLELVGELDEGKRWREDGATCTSAWLCARYGASKGSAIEHVRVARALRDLPATRDYDTPAGRLRLCHGIGDNDMARLHPDTTGYALECLDDAPGVRRTAGVAGAVGGGVGAGEALRLIGGEVTGRSWNLAAAPRPTSLRPCRRSRSGCSSQIPPSLTATRMSSCR